MTYSGTRKCIVAIGLLAALGGQSGRADDSHRRERDRDRQTATPIKHVIIIVGENRSFDHLFATYTPRHRHERVKNLLSEGIVNSDGSPGPHFAKAHQFQIASAPNHSR